MPSTWNTIRVFISSTFRDMHAERDHLVKVVFPALREELEKHRIHLVDVDLRWGVTWEQADNDQALGVCLDQIEACRPFFIGILGERYGHISNTLPADFGSRYNGMQQHTGRSITELEIRYGVLNNVPMRKHALFLFRDSAFLADLPADKRKDFEAEDAAAALKLEHLKRAIRKAGMPVVSYSCKYAGLKSNGDLQIKGLDEFGRQIAQWLLKAVQAEVQLAAPPASAKPDWLAEELDLHKRFMESRLRVYVGRGQINDALAAFVARNDPVACLVTGPSGSGKSAALAQFVTYLKTQAQIVVIQHFIGASPASTNPRQMLRRICSTLKECFQFTDEVPQDFNTLATLFKTFIARIPTDRRTVLVLDALNQLNATDNAHSLYWLPRELPGHVKLIASCIDDGHPAEPILQAFSERRYHPLSVPVLDSNEQRLIIQAVPSLSAKTLDEIQVDLLLSNPATSNPLFLLVALEELRGFGSIEHLDTRIAQLPHPFEEQASCRKWLSEARHAADLIPGEAQRHRRIQRLEQIDSVLTEVRPVDDTLTTLFLQVIKRLECDFDPQITEKVLSFLASVRRGLSQRELLDLIEGPGLKLSHYRGDLFPLLRQLRTHLLNRDELLDFYHRNLLKAVVARYLHSPSRQRAVHARLAEYFRLQADPGGDRSWSGQPPRGILELPYHLSLSGMSAASEAVLCDLVFAESKIVAGYLYDWIDDLDRGLREGAQPALAQIRTAVALDTGALASRPELTAQTLYNRLSGLNLHPPAVELALQEAQSRLDHRPYWIRSQAPLPNASRTGSFSFPEGQQYRVQSLSGDGKTLAVWGGSTDVRLLSTSTGEELARLSTAVSAISALEFGTGGDDIVLLQAGGNIQTASGRQGFALRPGDSVIGYNSKLGVFGVGTDGNLTAWDPRSGATTTLVVDVRSPLVAIDSSANGDCLAYITGRHTQDIMVGVRVADTWSVRSLSYVLPPVIDIDLDETGRYLLLATRDRGLQLIDLTDSRLRARLSYETLPEVAIRGSPVKCCLGLADSEGWVFAATTEGHILAWNWQTDEVQRLPDYRASAEAGSLSRFEVVPDSGNLFVSTESNAQWLSALSDPASAHQHQGPVDQCHFLNDAVIASLSTRDGTVCWSAVDGLNLQRRKAYPRPRSLATNPVNDETLIGMHDGSILIEKPFLTDTTAEHFSCRPFGNAVAGLYPANPEIVIAASDTGDVVRVHVAAGEYEMLRSSLGQEQFAAFLPAGSQGGYLSVAIRQGGHAPRNWRTVVDGLLQWLRQDASDANTTVVVSWSRSGRHEQTVSTWHGGMCDAAMSGDGNLVCLAGSELAVKRKFLFNWWPAYTRRIAAYCPVFLARDGLLAVALSDAPVLEVCRLSRGLPAVAAIMLPCQASSVATRGNSIAVGLVSGDLLSLRLKGSAIRSVT